MTFPSDSSRFPALAVVTLAALLLAAPAMAVVAKKPAKPAAKPAAAVVEPQPDPATLIAQARAAQGRGETELALRLAQAAIVADPARPSSYDVLADLYAANAAPDSARTYYGEALSIDPTDAAAQQAIAALDRRANDRRAANAAPNLEGTKTGNP